MAYFTLPFKMAATVYIQASSVQEAHSKLHQILSRDIDARDRRWFSGAPYGALFFPEFSFSTAMALFKPDAEVALKEVDLADVQRLMSSIPENTKSNVLPLSPDWFGEGKLPIYTVDLNVEATGIVEAPSSAAAHKFIEGLQTTGIHWEVADKWFEIAGLDTSFPLILSPSLKIVSMGEGCKFGRRWPEYADDFKISAAMNAEIENLGNGYKPLEVYALSRKLKSHFNNGGMSFSLLTDEDVLQIAGGLIEHLANKNAGIAHQGDLFSSERSTRFH